MRRVDNDYVNLTQLLALTNLAREDRLLELRIPSRIVSRGGIYQLQGSWVPLEVAQEIANRRQFRHLFWPILLDPDDLKDIADNERLSLEDDDESSSQHSDTAAISWHDPRAAPSTHASLPGTERGEQIEDDSSIRETAEACREADEQEVIPALEQCGERRIDLSPGPLDDLVASAQLGVRIGVQSCLSRLQPAPSLAELLQLMSAP
ncbi:Transcription factor mbp1 [Tilletia horrida]|nr:Transcription factor mbp1 [Tilletia horrida]